MNTRTEQRNETRSRIVAAAVDAFSEYGFHAASTRDIADRAGTKQGLVTYHFTSKDELWRAAVGHIFGEMNTEFAVVPEMITTLDAKSLAREAIRIFTRFSARHPELFRIMLSEAHVRDDRMHWLVDTYLQPLYDGFQTVIAPSMPDGTTPYAFYTVVGAASTIFAVAPECRRLTGQDPLKKKAIEAHADYITSLLIP